MALPAHIARLLDAAAARHGLAPELLRAVAWVESRGRADAVSPAGAMGVMQLMPNTANGLGVADPFDAAANIDGGARFLARLVTRFGEIPKALAAYNWGPARVERGSSWPPSVVAYVSKVEQRAAVERDALATEPTGPVPEGTSTAEPPFSPGWQALLPFSQPPQHCRSCTCFGRVDDDA